MEMSTVSPPPASPTEGDDLCDTDVTNVAIHSVTLLIGLCGLVGNGAVLWLLSWKGRTALIFGLAVIDFLFLLFVVPAALVLLLENMFCSTILPLGYMIFFYMLEMVLYYLELILLILVSFAMGVHKPFQLHCRSHISKCLLRMVLCIQGLALIITPMVIFLCQYQKWEQCQVALISMFGIILLLFPAPLAISSTINIIKAKCGSQKQQPKRRNIIVFLLVFFTLLRSLWNILQELSYLMFSHDFFLLTCIYSTINPLIYFLAGRCRRPCSMESLRQSLQRVFEEPEEKSSSSNDATMDTVI